MTLLFFILIVISCVVLGLIVLVQNPKGGGLAGTFGGLNNQFMGVKQTTDVLERGTWIFASIVGVLAIVSLLFFNNAGSTGSDNKLIKDLPTSTTTTPQNSAPAATLPATADSNK